MIALQSVAGATVAPPPRFLPAGERGIPGEYIVLLADGVARRAEEAGSPLPSVRETAERLTDLYGGTIGMVWEHAVQGFTLQIDAAAAERLAYDPSIRLVEQNAVLVDAATLPSHCYDYDDDFTSDPIAGSRSGAGVAGGVAQSIQCDDPDPRNPNRNCPDNWGLDRVDQTGSTRDGEYHYTTDAFGVHVYTIDTGINADHLEFVEFGPPFTRVIGGHVAIPGNSSLPTEDCKGHGTHVAGIIGGESKGLAKNVWLHPVKFFDSCDPMHEGGEMVNAVDAIDWVWQNHDPNVDGPAVVNFSGGNEFNWRESLAVAVTNLMEAGIAFVQSAGNRIQDACLWTVEGIEGLETALIVGGSDTNFVAGEWSDGLWKREGPLTTGGVPDPSYDDLCHGPGADCGSNTGECVDLFAPAAHIVSANTDDDFGFCYLSGTSLAAPHVTGAVALYLDANPFASPQQVHDAIVGGATCGVLDDDPSSPYSIGPDSPNLLLHSLLAGGGPAPCEGPPVEQPIGEVGRLNNLRSGLRTITLSRAYADPVVIAQPPSQNGSDTAMVRITSVASDRFTMFVHEAPDRDGPHTNETVSYLVVEAGSWKLSDGTELRAGELTTQATVGHRIANSWATVGYGGTFPNVPVVLSQIQTNNDPSWARTRHVNVGNASFQVALEEEESSSTAHGVETVGWIAVGTASGSWSGHSYRAGRTGNSVTDSWFTVGFGSSYGAAPQFLAAMPSYDGGHNAGLRTRSLTSTSVQVRVEEDTTWDSETAHTSEVVDYLVIGDPGPLTALPN